MLVLEICKSETVAIKTEQAMPRIRSNMGNGKLEETALKTEGARP